MKHRALTTSATADIGSTGGKGGLHQGAVAVFEFFWLAVLAGALWFAAFVFPITPAMAAEATPGSLIGLATSFLRGAFILLVAIIASAFIYGCERAAARAKEQRLQDDGLAAEALHPYGDASLLDRRP